MSVTIRNGGLKKVEEPSHHCALPPHPDLFERGTKISCDFCGRWYKAKVDRSDYLRRHYWKRLRKVTGGSEYWTRLREDPK